MSALDYSNISQYWSAEIQRDYRIALKLGDLQTQYTQRHMGGGGAADDDLNV